MRTHYSAITRFIVLGNAATTIAISLMHPYSQHGRALTEAGTSGTLAFLMVSAFVLVGFVDIVVNDLFPNTANWEWSHKYRHLGFMLLGAGQLGWYMEAYYSDAHDPVLIRYIWDMACSFSLAVYGIYQHVKDAKKEIIQVQQNRKRMLSQLGVE